MRKLELAGRKFGKLLVIEEVGKDRHGKITWLCRCECGKETNVSSSNLTSENSKSCGCVAVQKNILRNTTHGFTKRGNHTPEYHVWSSMIDRCCNPNNKRFPIYGGRGIEVCDRWLDSFENFIEDMGRRPVASIKGKREYSIERINNNSNYEKSNCRWATAMEQGRNKTDNHWIEYNGMKMILQDWARLFGAYQSNILRMLRTQPFEYVYNHYMNK